MIHGWNYCFGNICPPSFFFIREIKKREGGLLLGGEVERKHPEGDASVSGITGFTSATLSTQPRACDVFVRLRFIVCNSLTKQHKLIICYGLSAREISDSEE